MRFPGRNWNRIDRIGRALISQVAAVRAIVDVARIACVDPTARPQSRIAARRIEHAGDEARRDLALAVRRSLSHNLDREDLYRLSRSIDDVLDNIRDFIREADMFEIQSEIPALPILDAVDEALEALDTATTAIARRTHTVDVALALRKSSGKVRNAYQSAMKVLLSADEVTVEMLKIRELLRRLDVVGLRLAEAGATLADAAMKRE